MPAPARQTVVAVQMHRREQGLAAVAAQPVFEPPTEAAEVGVTAIPQGQQAVAQFLQRRAIGHDAAREGAGVVRRLAVAEGADHEQGVTDGTQARSVEAIQGHHRDRQARRLQHAGALPRQPLGGAALAGVAHQPRRRVRSAGRELAAALRAGGALLAAPVQIQQPAGDGEQRHGKARRHHDQPPRQAEIVAGVQGIHGGDELRAGARSAWRSCGGRCRPRRTAGAAGPFVARRHPGS